MSPSPGDVYPSQESFVPSTTGGGVNTGLAEFLQMCCLGRRSGQITFRSGESFGYVYVHHGRVLHAICGAIEGEEAVYRMLAWPPGTFALAEEITPREKTISSTWEQLLLEGGRRADEGVSFGPETVISSVPAAGTRNEPSQPKVTVNLPNERPLICMLEAEYTHVGRASGNEIPLVDPSVSNRHCMFILHGTDVLLRDLNSSNGTVVNGETISEVILRPGDLIQVGVVQMKFEPGMRRPKLTQSLPEPFGESDLQRSSGRLLSRTTLKLPTAKVPSSPSPELKDDSVFVKGESAISYSNLPKPEVEKKPFPVLIFLAVAAAILLLGGGYYYYLVVITH